MICDVHFSKRAKGQLDNLTKEDVTDIMGWIVSHLQGCCNPNSFATRLHGDLQDYLMYNVGRYNLYCIEEGDRVIILSVEKDNTVSN